METLTKPTKAAEKKLGIYSKKKGMKEPVERYYEEIHEKRMTTKEALEGMAEDYSSFMGDHYYQKLKYSIISNKNNKGIFPKDEWELYPGEKITRPEKVIHIESNCRYDIFGYQDSYFAVEIDTNERKRVLNFWEPNNGLDGTPESEMIEGIVFDKTINIKDTAFIENKGTKTCVRIKDLILDEVKVEYFD